MKLLKKLEDELAKVDTTQISTASTAPSDILTILASFKGVLIAVLNFIKLFTSDESDAKIDTLIAWLNSLPVSQ